MGRKTTHESAGRPVKKGGYKSKLAFMEPLVAKKTPRYVAVAKLMLKFPLIKKGYADTIFQRVKKKLGIRGRLG